MGVSLDLGQSKHTIRINVDVTSEVLELVNVEIDKKSYQKAMTRTRVMTVICINLLLQTPASASVEPWR